MYTQQTKRKQMNSTIPVLLISQHSMLGQLAVYNLASTTKLCVFIFLSKKIDLFYDISKIYLETYGSMWS